MLLKRLSLLHPTHSALFRHARSLRPITRGRLVHAILPGQESSLLVECHTAGQSVGTFLLTLFYRSILIAHLTIPYNDDAMGCWRCLLSDPSRVVSHSSLAGPEIAVLASISFCLDASTQTLTPCPPHLRSGTLNSCSGSIHPDIHVVPWSDRTSIPTDPDDYMGGGDGEHDEL